MSENKINSAVKFISDILYAFYFSGTISRISEKLQNQTFIHIILCKFMIMSSEGTMYVPESLSLYKYNYWNVHRQLV